MEFLTQLWLPIIASAAAVWFYGFLSWTVLPIHKGDFQEMKNHDGFMAAMKSLNIPPGLYGFGVFASHAEANKPDNKATWGKEPMGMLSVWRVPNMGANMALTFLVNLTVSVLIAYLGHEVMGPTAPFGKKLQIAGTAGILAYTFATLPGFIWFQAPAKKVLSHVFDGVMMGLVTGLVFAALWPKG